MPPPRSATLHPGRAAVLGAILAYGAGLWLTLLDHGGLVVSAGFAGDWLRTSTLALPLVAAAAWVALRASDGLAAGGRLAVAVRASAAAVAAAIAWAAAAPLAAWAAGDAPAGAIAAGRDALAAMAVALPGALAVLAAPAAPGRRARRPAPQPADGGATRAGFIRAGAAGAAGLGLAGTALSRYARPARATVTTDGFLQVYVNEGFLRMVDGSLVYALGYGERATALNAADPSLALTPHAFLANGAVVRNRLFPADAAPPPLGSPGSGGREGTEHLITRHFWGSYLPDRTIVAVEGATVRLRIRNRHRNAHNLVIQDVVPDLTEDRVVTLVDSGVIPPGEQRDVVFTAPRAGTYVYHDTVMEDVGRVLGLHGVLVVVPKVDRWRVFDGGPEFERQFVWIFHDIEPEWARLVRLGATVDPDVTTAVPRYFTLNGRSGVFSLAISLDEASNRRTLEDTKPSGHRRRFDVRDFSRRPGQLIRLVNTGIARHQAHFHGNHVRTVTAEGRRLSASRPQVKRNDGEVLFQMWEDVVQIGALDRKDLIMPIKPPPDAILAQDCDWLYPMHCHAEMSQTAAGGLYPNGLVSDWILKP